MIMSVLPEQDEITKTEDFSQDRRSFLKLAGATGLGLMAFGLLGDRANAIEPPAQLDHDIITAAVTAEALASTMYYNIIASPIYNVNLAGIINDQSYLVAGFQQEVDHYKLLLGAGGVPLATTFYFPNNMFTDPQTMVNTVVTLEDAFIVAYLFGVVHLSQNTLRQLAAQIMGVECEHRVLARDIGADLGLLTSTGLSGVPEGINGPTFAANNTAYERRFASELDSLNDIVKALTPFVAPGAPGFSTTPYPLMTTVPPGVIPISLANESPSA